MEIVVSDHTNCDELRRWGGHRQQQPKGAATPRMLKRVPADIVNAQVACRVDGKSKFCQGPLATNTQRQRAVNYILVNAQNKTVRSVEIATNRSMNKRVKYEDAVCTKLQQQVL